MKKLTKVQSEKILETAIDAHLNKGVDINDTANSLMTQGIDASVIMSLHSHIETIGKAKGWILTPEKIAEKVKAHITGKTISHFLDVLTLAKTLDIPQLSTLAEREQAIFDYSGVTKSTVSEPAKFKQFKNENVIHGKIAEWIKENPEFTASEIIEASSNFGASDNTNTANYANEFLAYREFFNSLYDSIKASKKA
jgi:hypothetical protein